MHEHLSMILFIKIRKQVSEKARFHRGFMTFLTLYKCLPALNPSLKPFFPHIYIIFPVIFEVQNELLQDFKSSCVCMLSCFSHVQLFVALQTLAHQAPLSMGFSEQEYWSGLPCPPPGILPDPEIEPTSLHLLHWQAGSLPRVPPGKLLS